MIDEHEQRARQRAVANAIGTTRLEGLEIDAVTLADMQRYARGEIDVEDVLRHIRERLAAGDFYNPPAVS